MDVTLAFHLFIFGYGERRELKLRNISKPNLPENQYLFKSNENEKREKYEKHVFLILNYSTLVQYINLEWENKKNEKTKR